MTNCFAKHGQLNEVMECLVKRRCDNFMVCILNQSKKVGVHHLYLIIKQNKKDAEEDKMLIRLNLVHTLQAHRTPFFLFHCLSYSSFSQFKSRILNFILSLSFVFFFIIIKSSRIPLAYQTSMSVRCVGYLYLHLLFCFILESNVNTIGIA